jgi:uncharacterized protein (DUF362 family)
MSDVTRRRVLAGAGALAAGSVSLAGWRIAQQPAARVMTIRAENYDVDLVDLMLQGIRAFPQTVARARGGRVVLKPNLVEYSPDRPINTDPRVIAAAAAAFLELGAASVVVAEGPGHRRDTELLVEASGLGAQLDRMRLPFVDLNVDAVDEVKLKLDVTGLGRMSIGQTVTRADLLVSVAKLKTHHWAGATLTMKNLFGTVPGAVYGWPKNPLHWAGIDASIIELWSALSPGFGIIDGIVGMEGDGPIMGTPRPTGALLMSDNLPAVDATAARLMGIVPEALAYLERATWLGGTTSPLCIERVGDLIAQDDYRVLDHLSGIKST